MEWKRVYDMESSIHAVEPSAPWRTHPFKTTYDVTCENSNRLQTSEGKPVA